MDWRILLSTFGLVFLAELGDKTQLATLCMAARYHSPLAVFVGAAFALTTITFISVLLAEGLIRVVPLTYLNRLTGLLFIVIGAIILLGR